jgi:uncharacterized membrane protein
MAKSTKWLDGVAVGLSALCLIHCLALPIIVAGLPFMAQFADGHLHAQMLWVVLPLSIVALGLGYRHHSNLRIILAGCAGMALLTIGALVAHDHWGVAADRAFTISGALVLAAAHFYNSVQTRERRKTASS